MDDYIVSVDLCLSAKARKKSNVKMNLNGAKIYQIIAPDKT